MSSSPAPAESRPSPASLIFADLRLPPDIRLGIAFLITGLAFVAASFVWPYFFAGTVLSTGSIAAYMQISLGLSLGELLSGSLGVVLVFRGILRLLPPIGAAARLGPLLILVGALLFSVGYGSMIFLAYSIYPPFGASLPTVYYELSTLLGVGGQVLTVIGSVLAFVAVARGAMAVRRDLGGPAGF